MKDNITKELDVLAAIELSRTTPEVRYIFMEKSWIKLSVIFANIDDHKSTPLRNKHEPFKAF